MVHPDDRDDYPMSNADVLRDQHTESILLGHGCPFDCAACDPEFNGQQAEWDRQDAEAAEIAEHEAFRSHIEIFRAEAIATGETVTVVWA